MTREEALAVIKEAPLYNDTTYEFANKLHEAIETLEQSETAQWISKGDPYPAWKYCSKCKEPWTFDCGTPNHCPNCGRKMESEIMIAEGKGRK